MENGTEYRPKYTSDSMLESLQKWGIQFEHYRHIPVFTVESANEVSHQIPGLHTRNLFLKDKKGKMYLVTLRHDTPVDLKKLSTLLGAGRFSFGSPERLWTNLGVRPGSVTPLSILNDAQKQVQLILEEAMMQGDAINFHPLLNDQTVSMAPSELLRILSLQNIDYKICDLSIVAPDAGADMSNDPKPEKSAVC
ncbi:MAG: prolyl-tRNA synthetase associated domain-containing protein [Alphaproteobacteria bacterium]|nr:prolyl-tRNA synthetase associated domain-containing protein [Alphaproteobacteria bacterium]HPJ81829.1 prolyl-tRNA synthetase associated domain-containing protein [Saccharofermentans sp.]